jgi:hypothetical protein
VTEITFEPSWMRRKRIEEERAVELELYSSAPTNYVCSEHTLNSVSPSGRGCRACAARKTTARRDRLARRAAARNQKENLK